MTSESRAKRLNVPLVIGLLVAVVAVLVGVYLLHGLQVRRLAHSMLARAQNAEKQYQKLEGEGKKKEAGAQLTEAVRNYDGYLTYVPEDKEAYGRLALLVSTQARRSGGDPRVLGNAFRVLDRASSLEPDNMELMRRLVDVSIDVQRLDVATDGLKRLIQKYPEESELVLKLARCQIAAERFTDALGSFQDVISGDPQNVGAYVELANLYRNPRVDLADKADATINQMVASNPDSVRARAEQGMYWLRVNETETDRKNQLEADSALKLAKTAIAAAIEKGPDDVDALLAAVELAMVDKQMDQAEQYLGRAEALFPAEDRVHLLRGRLSRLRNKPEEERVALEKAAGKDPQKLFQLADAYLRQQPPDIDAVRNVLRQIKKAGFRDEIIDFYNARILIAEGKIGEAAQALERLVVRTSQWPEFRAHIDIYLGGCYEQLGLPDRQLEVFQRVLKEDPTVVPARAGYVSALMRTGKIEEAYKELLKLRDAVGSEEFLKEPALRIGLYQCLVARTAQLPEAERDWGPVDQLLSDMEKVKDMDAVQLALMKAELLVKKGQLAQARDLVAAQRDAHPEQLALWTALANVQAMSGEKAEAVKTLDEAARRLGNTPALALARVTLAVRLEPEAGRELLASVGRDVEKLPAAQKAALWQTMGNAYYRLRDRDTARHYWEQAVQARPRDARLHKILFELARETDDELGMRQQADAIKTLSGADSADWRYCEASRLVWLVQSRPQEPKEQNLSRAKDLLKGAAEQRPTWHEIPRLQAEIAVLEGRLDDAIDSYQRADSLGTLGSVSLGQLVRLLYLRGRDEEAKALIARLGPDQPSPLLQKISAEIEVREGDLDEAIRRAEKSVAGSENPVDHLWYGQLLARAKRYDEAEKALRHAVELDPSIPQTWLSLVALLVQADKKDEAQKVLLEAQLKLPEDRMPLALGLGYELLGNLDEAQRHFLNAAELQPENLAVARRVADFYLRHNRGEQARRLLSEMVKLAEKDPKGHANDLVWSRRALAGVLASGGDYRQQEQALALLDKNASAGRPSPDDLRLKAAILGSRGDRTSRLKAIGIYDGLLQRKLNLAAEDQLRLARLYDETNRWSNCRDLMTELTAKYHKDGRLLAAFVEMLLRREAPPAEIRPLVERLQEILPGDPVTVALQARLLAKEGKPAEAVALLKTLVADPLPQQQAGRLVQVAMLLEELGQTDEAQKMFTDFAGKVPGGSLALAAFLGRQGKVREALAQCEAALADVPAANVLPTALAVLRGNPDGRTPEDVARVETWVKKALDESPNSPNVQLHLADLREIEEKYDEVIRVYRDFLARTDVADHDKAAIRNNLAYILAVLERGGSEALELSNQAIDVLGPTPDLLDTRSLANLVAGQFPAAVADARQSITDSPSAMKYFHLARALLASGDRQAAARAIQVARDNHQLGRDKVPPAERDQFDKLESAVKGV